MDSRSKPDTSAQLVLFEMAKPASRQRSGPINAAGFPNRESGDLVAKLGQAERAISDMVRPSGKSHTPAHINCEACEGTRGMYVGSISRSMSFSEAANFYLNWRSAPAVPGRRIQFVGKRTLKDYKQKAKALEKFFGEMKLEEIQYKNLTGYQEARLTANGYTRFYGKREVASPAGAIKINSELALLKRLMEMAQCWTPELEMYYDPFQQMEPDEQKALDPEQQETFLKTAAAVPRWYPIWWYGLVALHLTFSSDEMRTLRLGDINLHHQTVSVNSNYGKNFARRRTNTIDDGACGWALQRLMDRAQQLGATAEKYKGPQPNYFLLPRRVVRNLYDPELPMGETGLRKLFEEVRAKAGVPWFHFNAFRHTGATRLAESGISPYILEERMGHVGPKMMRRYVQISQQSQRTAVRNACAKKPVISIKREDERDWRMA